MDGMEVVVPREIDEIDAAIFLVRTSDKASAMSRELLHRISEGKLYEGRFSSFKEFVESPDGLGKTASWASKQLKVYQHYVINGGVSQVNLEGIDNERLYIAGRIPNLTTHEQLNKATTLSRSELTDELASTPEGDCQHGYPVVTICSHCSKRVTVYESKEA